MAPRQAWRCPGHLLPGLTVSARTVHHTRKVVLDLLDLYHTRKAVLDLLDFQERILALEMQGLRICTSWHWSSPRKKIPDRSSPRKKVTDWSSPRKKVPDWRWLHPGSSKWGGNLGPGDAGIGYI